MGKMAVMVQQRSAEIHGPGGAAGDVLTNGWQPKVASPQVDASALQQERLVQAGRMA